MSLDTKIAPLPIGAPATSSRGSFSSAVALAKAEDPPQGEGQRLARLAGEFESMLLVQMLREMRKSGSWEDEKEDKSGFGAETLFEMIDVELASYLTKAQGLGLEKSLTKQVTGNPAGGVNAVPANLPSESITERVETSPFGWRRDPFSGATTYHRGVDLRAAYGEPIGAADAGKVVFAGEQGGYGQTVVVEHAGGVRTRYAHLSSVMTEAGADVKAGEAIGRAGRSGRATGTHLHFEVTQNGHPVDPHSLSAGGLKVERVTADWGVGTGPTLPGVPSDAHGSGAD